MHIIWCEKSGTVTFLPVDAEDGARINFVIPFCEKAAFFRYVGKIPQPGNPSWGVKFNVGGVMQDGPIEYKEGYKIIRSFVVGGKDFDLLGSSLKDKELVDQIQSMCFGRVGGLSFLDFIKEGEAIIGLVFTGTCCKKCARTVIGKRRCQYQICDHCTQTCQHVWGTGSDYCAQCGTARSVDPVKGRLTLLATYTNIRDRRN